MKRVYDQGDKIEDVKYFVGTEVEQTPQYGKKTLFVVGINDPKRSCGGQKIKGASTFTWVLT